MRATLQRAAKTGAPGRSRDVDAGRRALRAAPRSGTHASRWTDDELATRAPRLPRLRAERRARRTPLGGETRVGPSELYGYDAHGNIAFLTDAAGAETDRYTYDAWGILVASMGSTANTRLYVGEELDSDLGLMNLRARQYSAGLGRFLTLDPITDGRPTSGSSSRYALEDVNTLIFGLSLAARGYLYSTVATAYFAGRSNAYESVVGETADFLAILSGGPDIVSLGVGGLIAPNPYIDAVANGVAIGAAGVLIACEINALSAFDDGTINTTNRCPSPCVCK